MKGIGLEIKRREKTLYSLFIPYKTLKKGVGIGRCKKDSIYRCSLCIKEYNPCWYYLPLKLIALLPLEVECNKIGKYQLVIQLRRIAGYESCENQVKEYIIIKNMYGKIEVEENDVRITLGEGEEFLIEEKRFNYLNIRIPCIGNEVYFILKKY